VCTTWYVHEKKFYLIDVLRGRFDYPTLRSRAIAHAQAYGPHRILIEDAGVGTALVAELKRSGLTAIAVKPEQDKVTRMSIESRNSRRGWCCFHAKRPGSRILRTSCSASRTGATTIRLTPFPKPSAIRALPSMRVTAGLVSQSELGAAVPHLIAAAVRQRKSDVALADARKLPRQIGKMLRDKMDHLAFALNAAAYRDHAG
jgi:predicted phage terminase large subunit-like protein